MVDHSTSPPQRLTPQQAAPAIFHAMFSQVGRGGAGWTGGEQPMLGRGGRGRCRERPDEAGTEPAAMRAEVARPGPLPTRPSWPSPPSLPLQTIMLLLGGFAIAAALSKHAIAKQVGREGWREGEAQRAAAHTLARHTHTPPPPHPPLPPPHPSHPRHTDRGGHPVPRGPPPPRRAPGGHVHGHVRKHVDQQRGRTRAVLRAGAAHPAVRRAGGGRRAHAPGPRLPTPAHACPRTRPSPAHACPPCAVAPPPLPPLPPRPLPSPSRSPPQHAGPGPPLRQGPGHGHRARLQRGRHDVAHLLAAGGEERGGRGWWSDRKGAGLQPEKPGS
jgi:hypothetical protein